MWSKDEFLKIASEPLHTNMQPVLTTLEGYDKQFFFLDKDQQDLILCDIINACDSLISSIDTKTSGKLSEAEFNLKYPNVLQALELQKQAVRLLYMPDINFHSTAPEREDFNELRTKFLHSKRMALLKNQIQLQGRNLQEKYWDERRFAGYTDVASWLTQDYGKNIKIESYNEIVSEKPNVNYFEEPEKFIVSIHDGKLMINNQGSLKPIDEVYPYSLKENDNGIYIFVMDLENNLYLHPLQLVDSRDYYRTQHSSFLHGENVACAGHMHIRDGKIYKIKNKSGHYNPDPKRTLRALSLLETGGIDLKDVIFTDVHSNLSYNAALYLKTKGYCLPEHKDLQSVGEPFLKAAQGYAKFGDANADPLKANKYFDMAINLGSLQALGSYGILLFYCESKGIGLMQLSKIVDGKSVMIDTRQYESQAKANKELAIKHFKRLASITDSPQAIQISNETGKYLYDNWKLNRGKNSLELDLAAELGYPQAIFKRAIARISGDQFEKNIDLGINELHGLIASQSQNPQAGWDFNHDFCDFLAKTPTDIKTSLLEKFNTALLFSIVQAIQAHQHHQLEDILETGFNPVQRVIIDRDHSYESVIQFAETLDDEQSIFILRQGKSRI